MLVFHGPKILHLIIIIFIFQAEVCCKYYRVMPVTREGKCVQFNFPRQLIFGTMVFVWHAIVADASYALSWAICIATRYSAVHREFGSNDGGVETQVFC